LRTRGDRFDKAFVIEAAGEEHTFDSFNGGALEMVFQDRRDAGRALARVVAKLHDLGMRLCLDYHAAVCQLPVKSRAD
jgi:hypothetical protein